MEILIDSDSARSIINRHGLLGVEWVEELPGQLESLAVKWQLEDLQPVPGSVTAFIFFATQNGTPVVLKAAPDHPRLAKEAAALEQWAASGLVPKIMGRVGGCYMMSRITPGEVWQGSDQLVYQALQQLHNQDGERPSNMPTAKQQLIDRLDRLKIQQSGREMGISGQDFILAKQLVSSAPESGSAFKLLHTDLHPRALLTGSGKLPWLVDPSPAWGPAAWDLAAWAAKNGGPLIEQRVAEGSEYLNYSLDYVQQISRAISIEGAAVTARYGISNQEEVDLLLAWGRSS